MTHDLWTTASANVEAEAAERRLAMAKVALSELWPFLAAASSEDEYATRKTIVAPEINAVIAHVAGEDTGTAAELRTEVLTALDSDFAVHAEARAAKAVTAALAEGARFPVVAGQSSVTCPNCDAPINPVQRGNQLVGDCDQCGWHGTKTKKSSVTADAHNDGSGAFRVDVRGVGESKWSSNSMSYDTEEEAKAAAQSLYSRWMGMDMARVVPNSVPRGEAVDTSDPTIVVGASRKTADDDGDKTGHPTAAQICPYCDFSGTNAEVAKHIEDAGPDHQKDGTVTDQMNKKINSSRKVAVDLTNIRTTFGDTNVFVGKDSSGKDVKFRVKESDAQALRGILNSDLAMNFSGVSVTDDEIIKDASRKTAGTYEKGAYQGRSDAAAGIPRNDNLPERDENGDPSYRAGYINAYNQWVYSNADLDDPRVKRASLTVTAGDTAVVSVLPNCDVCKYDEGRTTQAVYDAKLVGKGGSWGNVCERHFDMYGPGQLGTGYGQRLITASTTASVQGARFRGRDGR